MYSTHTRDWLLLAVQISVWLGCSQIHAGMHPLMFWNLLSSSDWRMLFKRKKGEWVGRVRGVTRKYFMIWDFIQSCMGIPDLSLDARVILRKALSIKDGILFFQPLHPQPPHLLVQLQAQSSCLNTVEIKTIFLLQFSPLLPLLYHISVCLFLSCQSVTICLFYLACTVANLI